MARGTEYSSSPLARFRRYRERRVPYFSRPRPTHDWHWALAVVGKTLITVGLLMFAFVGYQLWGTGIQTAQAQDRLEDEFNEKLAATTTTSTVVTTTVPGESTVPTTVPVAPPTDTVALGDPIAILRIPRIGLSWQVVEGVSVADLRNGPGHFPETVMPGQLGNSAIAGHRTTYGEPFRELDELEVGDLIELTTLVGVYTYAVTGTVIVKPTEYGSIVPTIDPTVATLVLVTCDPVYTARNRLVVRATLVPENSSQVYAPPTTTTTAPTTTPTTQPGTVASTATTAVAVPEVEEPLSEDAFSDGWFSDQAAIPHVVGWGLVLFAVGIGAHLAGRAANRLYVSFLVGVLPFLIVLYFFFENVNRLLPPGL